ncbi:MAG: hypothetical protein KME49_24025 [Brasilonema octagenarum HA4186-MV1]|uniref:hypothetical protein n=1 Tax=Brasilonema TaxID=383614 RepID=UPI00145DC298|nr:MULTISPECIES: hypothetical protein [Brasilonema]MBW4628498.1 hypothetical protein [Brasilonema octagenarum HA4186-MV1]
MNRQLNLQHFTLTGTPVATQRVRLLVGVYKSGNPDASTGKGGQMRDCRETLTEVAHGEPVRCG